MKQDDTYNEDTSPEEEQEDHITDHPPTDGVDESADAPKTSLEEMTEEELLLKAKEYKDRSLRLAADYQNLQRETEQRISDMRKYATDGLIQEIAPLVDYFDSAFSAVPEEEMNSGWMQGIKYIQNHLIKVLEDHGVQLIEAVGKQLDTQFHEAVDEVESDQPSGTVIKQTQAGLMLHGKVIRHAKVVVAK